MKISQIKDVVDNLCKNDKISTILINGSWGVGKTYATTKALQNIKGYKSLYSSLFGKTSIDEINTELYSRLNNSKEKILNTVSKVVSLIGTSISYHGIGINLNGTTFGRKRSIKNTKKNKVIVVLDDLERMDTSKINRNELLGYINQLNLQGIKVIVLANLDEKKDDNFEEFKEKVFDRLYSIEETQLEAAQSLASKEVVDKECLSISNNNLRLIIKAYSLYKQICDYLKEKKVDEEDPAYLYRLCLYVVVESLTCVISKQYVESLPEWRKKYLEADSKIAKVEAISDCEHNRYGTENVNGLLISALFDIFEKENYTKLDELYFSQQKSSVLLEEVFWASDERKIEIIKTQYDYILNKASFRESYLVSQAISKWYKYCFYMDLSFIDKNKLFEKMHELGITGGSIMVENNFVEIRNEYDSFCKQRDFAHIKNILEKKPVDLSELHNTIVRVSQEYTSYSQKKQDYIRDQLLNNSFYITNIDGNMSETEWSMVHRVCNLISKNISNLRKKLYDYLNDLKNSQPSNKTLQHRATILQERYLKDYCSNSQS